MFDVLLLRLDAPMMSFGSVMIDNFGRTLPFPGISMLTGLFGNALGLCRRNHQQLEALQSRIRHAVRRDRGGDVLHEYQTVDLGQDFLQSERAWTSWGVLDPRMGQSGEVTHERFRDYLMDSQFTVAVTLRSGPGPSLDELEKALDHPRRPLFLGRKSCPPAARLVLGRAQASSLREAVISAPSSNPGKKPLWWPAGDSPEHEKHPIFICDLRDWENQIHGGRTHMFEDAP